MGLTHTDFMALFDQWANTYDQTVQQADPVDGFEDYQAVLDRVVELSGAGPGLSVLDIGTGTGNLAAKLMRTGAEVTAVEPSAEMRRVAVAKLGAQRVLDGHFRAIPAAGGQFDAVVSTYAFHHLPDSEKGAGARELLRVLRPGGRLVLGDVAWADGESRLAMIRRFAAEGKQELVREIEEEYYPTVGLLVSLFAAEGCSVFLEQVNDWVWLLVARKRPA